MFLLGIWRRQYRDIPKIRRIVLPEPVRSFIKRGQIMACRSNLPTVAGAQELRKLIDSVLPVLFPEPVAAGAPSWRHPCRTGQMPFGTQVFELIGCLFAAVLGFCIPANMLRSGQREEGLYHEK